MTLADIAHRLATDATFANHVQQDPVAAIKAVGSQLSDEEHAAVLAILNRKPRWQDLCQVSEAPRGQIEWHISPSIRQEQPSTP
jgi:hypothetical protein